MKINRKILLTLFLGTTLLLNPVLGMDQSALEKKRLEKSQERNKLVRSNSSPELRKFEGKSEQKTTEQNIVPDFKLSPAPQTIGSTKCISCNNEFSFFNKYIKDTPKICTTCIFRLLGSSANNKEHSSSCNADVACKICSFWASCGTYNNHHYPICSLCLTELEKWATEEEQNWNDKEVKERLEKDSYDKKN